MDLRILSYILLPSSTAETMVAKLSSASTMSATPLVTSVPVMPMPMPISAFLMEGASLTPSPVMAVTLPFFCHILTMRTLCSGCTLAYTVICSISFSNSASDISLSSAPVMAFLPSESMPSSFAIATAVSLWSPVIMTVWMPALWHSSMAGFTSGLTGSIMPESPTKQSPVSMAEGSVSEGISFQFFLERASTRRALSAMALLAARTPALSSSVSSVSFPSTTMLTQFLSTSSGAPLVYWVSFPVSSLMMTDIIFRMESKGASPTLSKPGVALYFLKPALRASFTRAHSVASPTASPTSSL